MKIIKIIILLLLLLLTFGCTTSEIDSNIESEDVDGIQIVIEEIDDLNDYMHDDEN